MMDSPPGGGSQPRLSAKAVWQIAKRYQQGGLDRGLFDGARPGKAPALDQEQRQRIIAVPARRRRRDGHAGPYGC